MATNDAEFADHLNRYLDVLVTEAHNSSNGRIVQDHELADAIQQLRTHDDAPSVDPRFADHLLETLMHSNTTRDAMVFPGSQVLPAGLAPFPSLPNLPQKTAARPHWQMSHLATAALVLLVLAGSMFALGSQRSLNTGWAPMLPALSSTPTADSEVVTETLISTSFDSLPNGPATIAAYFVDLQPGVSASMGNQVGTMAYFVDRGTVRVVHDDLEQVLHAGERWSAPVRDFSSFENVGDEDATIVEVDVLDTIASSSADAYTEGVFSDPIGGSSSFVIEAATDLPGGPGEVTLQRLTVPPGGTLAPYIQTELDWIGIAEGRVGVTLVGEQRLPFRWDSGEERTYGVSPSLPVIAPGTEITLRNAEDTPLVIYHLTIEPSEATGSPDGSPVP